MKDAHWADNRLAEDTSLSEQDIRDILPLINNLTAVSRARLTAELELIQLSALKRQEQLANRQLESFAKFDESTAKANGRMLGFTAAVTLMTLVQLGIAVYQFLQR